MTARRSIRKNKSEKLTSGASGDPNATASEDYSNELDDSDDQNTKSRKKGCVLKTEYHEVDEGWRYEGCHFSNHDDSLPSSERLSCWYQFVERLKTFYTFKSKFTTFYDTCKRLVLKSKLISCFIIIFILAIVLIACDFGKVSDSIEVNNEEVKKHISKIEQSFKNQNRLLWINLTSAINAEISGKHPHTVVLLLVDGGDDQGKKTSSCLASEVARLPLYGTHFPPIVLNGTELKMNEKPGKDQEGFVDEYRLEMEKRKRMLIANLEDFPFHFALVLHHFCDKENPLVKESMYVLTMSVTSPEEPLTKNVEEALTNLWKNDKNQDTLQPLITRLADQVFLVQSEKELPCE